MGGVGWVIRVVTRAWMNWDVESTATWKKGKEESKRRRRRGCDDGEKEARAERDIICAWMDAVDGLAED